MRYALLAAIAVVLGACTEPTPATYFEGKISSIWIVKDVFGAGETTYLGLDDGDAANGCEPSVKVTDATEISFIETDPAIHGTRADFHHGQTIRVSPPRDPAATCPMEINATFVRIMQPAPAP